MLAHQHDAGAGPGDVLHLCRLGRPVDLHLVARAGRLALDAVLHLHPQFAIDRVVVEKNDMDRRSRRRVGAQIAHFQRLGGHPRPRLAADAILARERARYREFRDVQLLGNILQRDLLQSAPVGFC